LIIDTSSVLKTVFPAHVVTVVILQNFGMKDGLVPRIRFVIEDVAHMSPHIYRPVPYMARARTVAASTSLDASLSTARVARGGRRRACIQAAASMHAPAARKVS